MANYLVTVSYVASFVGVVPRVRKEMITGCASRSRFGWGGVLLYCGKKKNRVANRAE